jgi:hypothetical protein
MAQQYIGTARLGTHQSVAYTGTAGTIATAISSGIHKVRVYVTTAAYIKIGKDVTATTSDVPMAADAPEYFTIKQGEKVSAVQVTSGGTLHVTECD